ncbi:MAG: hypothetical protein MI802_07060, partial [Desulfobacterales bacterium]|nr:hypothetical protein [Desulfobacterales bacterium]
MQGLIFIYEPERSKKNNQFTVRIEERRKQGTIWKQVGPKGFYTARDLQAPGLKIVDRQLFSMAFKAETDLRKQEGRFFSPDGEYTLFRISPYDLKSFLHRCRDRSVLCNAEGQPVHFKYRTGIVPGVEFHPSGDRFTPELTLAGKPMKPSDYTVISNPVRILCGRMVYELKRGLPYPLVHKLSQGRPLSSEAYEALLDELAGHTGKIDIRLPGIKKKILKKASATPVLNIDPGFKFAGLAFSYEGFGTFAPDDPRPVIFYPETNTELHRDFETERRYSEMLKTSGLSHRPTPQGEWFIPKGQREALLKDIADNGFRLMLSGRPLHLDARIDWEITTGEHAISVGGIVHSGGKK